MLRDAFVADVSPARRAFVSTGSPSGASWRTWTCHRTELLVQRRGQATARGCIILAKLFRDRFCCSSLHSLYPSSPASRSQAKAEDASRAILPITRRSVPHNCCARITAAEFGRKFSTMEFARHRGIRFFPLSEAMRVQLPMNGSFEGRLTRSSSSQNS